MNIRIEGAEDDVYRFAHYLIDALPAGTLSINNRFYRNRSGDEGRLYAQIDLSKIDEEEAHRCPSITSRPIGPYWRR